MAYLQQLLQLPYAHLWIPGLIFLVVVGGIYGLLRRSSPAAEPAASAAVVQPGAVALVTAGPMQPKREELRQSKRRDGNSLEIFVADPDDKSNPQHATVRDRSMGGLRLSAYRAIEVGTVISVRPVNVSAIVPWVDVEVRSCRPSEELSGEFDVGCQFVKTPPYSILMLFG